jgi:very-short-patch-repair endonuclease
MGIISEDILRKLYYGEKLSTRKIASKLNAGKTTIEYYFKKFNIKRRTQKEALFLCKKEIGWTRGLTKEKDERLNKLAKSIKNAYKIKREKRIKEIEKKFDKPIKDVIPFLYWDKRFNQEQISKEIGFDRKIVMELMDKHQIKRRPKYKYISSLKGKDHLMFGKNWENHFGKEKSDKRKNEYAKRFRELTIRRIENNEFPFFDTEIEKIIAKEMIKRKILFVKQFRVGNKFVCDFAIPLLKIIIECDGDYWHANPKIYDKNNLTKTQKKKVQIDKIKDNFLKKRGWIVLRFFETNIKSKLDECIFKIEETINKRMKEIKKIKSPIDNLI